MNFSLVCRSWRGVTMEQPSLWSSLYIRFMARTRVDSSLLRMVRIWLKNSSNAPLDIHLAAFIHHGFKDPVFENIYSTILEQQHHWNAFHIDVVHPHLDRSHMTISSASVTSLWMSLDTGGSRQFPVTFDLANCPQLKELNIRSGVDLSITNLKSKTLWLPKLSILCFTMDANTNALDIQRMLLASPNLSVLGIRIELNITVSQSLATQSTLALSSLTRLSIGNGNRTVVLDLIGWLNCPNLTHFEVTVPVPVVGLTHEQCSIT